MKYQQANYLQFPMEAYERCANLKNPNGALVLYLALKKLEHQFCTAEKDYFYRSDEQLTEDAHMSLPTIKRHKKELKQVGLITTEQRHFIDDNGKKSEKRVTVYRIL